jgi:hypothetical protein
MGEMTREQQQALALASARLRLQQESAASTNATGLEQPVQAPTRSWGDVPGEALGNVIPSAKRFAGGVVEAVTSPVQTAKTLFQTAGGAVVGALPQSAQDWLISVANNPETVRQSIEMANQVGGFYKDRYGSLEGLKNTLATDPVGAAADLSTLLSGGAAATSRVAPAASNALSTAARLTNPMTPIVAAAELPVKALARTAQAGYNAMSPKSKAYMTAVEGKGQEIVNALRSPNVEIVPGSQPTAAQAAMPAGSTRFAALGQQAAEKLSTPHLARQTAQKEAQLDAIRSVGKTADDIKLAEASRAAETNPLYQIADKAVVATDKTFDALTQRPSMDKVLARAAQLAEEKGQPFMIGENRAAQTVPSPILDASGKPIGFTTTPAEVAQFPGTSLHYMKLAFDDLVHDPATFGIGKNEAGAIAKTRGDFLNWVDTKIPEYGQARELFASGSKPINQMQVGQFLEGKLVPALGEETGKLRAAAFAGAVENAPATIKKAVTGAPRYDSLAQIMTPEQMAVIDGVKADLSRIAETEYAARMGAKSGPNLLKSATEAWSGVQAPNLINQVTTVANEIIRRLKGGVNEKVAIEIATEMLDPKAAAASIEKAMARQARGDRMFDPFKKPSISPEKTRNIGVATEGINNALSPEQRERNSLRIELRGMANKE